MDIELDSHLPQSVVNIQKIPGTVEKQIIIYWGISILLGAIFLRDWLMAWNVAQTWQNPWLVALLFLSWTAGQTIYIIVAHHDNRPIRWLSTFIFGLGNGIFETLTFASIYRIGEVSGTSLFSLFAPNIAREAGFVLGGLFFVVFGGLVHGLFWIKVLPPHFHETPFIQAIRKWRPLTETILVVGWSLCFWLNRDIWTVIFFHTLIDFVLMLRVRPAIFVAKSKLF